MQCYFRNFFCVTSLYNPLTSDVMGCRFHYNINTCVSSNNRRALLKLCPVEICHLNMQFVILGTQAPDSGYVLKCDMPRTFLRRRLRNCFTNFYILFIFFFKTCCLCNFPFSSDFTTIIFRAFFSFLILYSSH